MQKTTIQFATVTKDGESQRVGNSFIYQSKIQYDGRKTKWFDDTNLIRRKQK